MFNPDLGDRNYDLKSFSNKADRKFLTRTLERLDERSLAWRLRNKVDSVLLVSSIGSVGLGVVSGRPEVLAGGVGLLLVWAHIWEAKINRR